LPSVAAIPSCNKLSSAGLPWELHAACAAWPEMKPAELRDLSNDIAAHGLRDPITLTPDGLLLDGRNRALACVMAGIEPATVVYADDPVLFSLSRNAQRRHMNADQIAMATAELVAMKPIGANQHKGGPIGPPSIAKAAETAGITKTALKSAKVVHKHGTPAEIRAVKSGAVPLYKKADDVRARQRALAPPAPPKSKSKPAKPAADPIDGVARDIRAKCSDGEWRPSAKIAFAVKVAESTAKDALRRLGDAVTTRVNGAVVEYRIESSDEAHLRRSLAAKDREIAALKQRIAEQDLEIKRLKEQLAAPPLATAAE
jgi:hypothetical protein